MNIPESNPIPQSRIGTLEGVERLDHDYQHFVRNNQNESFWGRFSFARRSVSAGAIARRERDIERGYSIIVKQVVLAFAVEFVIIGLILTLQVQNALKNNDITIVYFFIALSMVELARVPLALAVRTQNSWHIKLFAVLGVLCAVAVTSVSLYYIGVQSLDSKLKEVNILNEFVVQTRTDLESNIDTVKKSYNAWQQKLQQKIDYRNSLSEKIANLQKEFNRQQNVTSGQTTITNPDGTQGTKAIFRENPAIAILKKELASQTLQLDAANAAVAQTEAERPSQDISSDLNAKFRAAERNYNDAVNHSLLHSVASSRFGKDPQLLDLGEVKSVELWLILIPSIAAAFSSTLIAITAVRRIKSPKSDPVVSISDEAANFLFGPLLLTIKKAADDAVKDAMNGHAKAKVTAETAKT